MFDDLTKEIKSQLYERAKGPLFTTFAISWISFNIRSITVFFSDLDPERKIGYWNDFYPTTVDWLLHCLAYPSLTAVAIIIVYPIPARLAYHYWHWQFLKVKKVQQKLEDETPMTHEEAGALRLVSLEQQSKLQEQLRAATTINTEQSNRLAAISQQLIDSANSIEKLTQEKNQLIEDKHLFDKSLESSDLTKSKDENSKDNINKSNLEIDGSLFSLIPTNVLNNLLDQKLEYELIEVFVAIYCHEGEVERKALNQYLKLHSKLKPIEIQFALDKLQDNKGFIKIYDSGRIVLSKSGTELAVKSGLSQVEVEE